MIIDDFEAIAKRVKEIQEQEAPPPTDQDREDEVRMGYDAADIFGSGMYDI
jgi:hypothetical protein